MEKQAALSPPRAQPRCRPSGGRCDPSLQRSLLHLVTTASHCLLLVRVPSCSLFSNSRQVGSLLCLPLQDVPCHSYSPTSFVWPPGSWPIWPPMPSVGGFLSSAFLQHCVAALCVCNLRTVPLPNALLLVHPYSASSVLLTPTSPATGVMSSHQRGVL